MGPFSLITKLFDPIKFVTDKLGLTGEAKNAVDGALLAAKAGILDKELEYQTSLAESRASVLIAEIQSESYITRTWRPMLMVLFGAVIVGGVFFDKDIPVQLWWIIGGGIGGYIPARSIDKANPGAVVDGIKAIAGIFGKKE